jgi:hypothetical protein
LLTTWWRLTRRSLDDGDLAAAHVLATWAGYAYADVATVAMMMARLGLQANACVEDQLAGRSRRNRNAAVRA